MPGAPQHVADDRVAPAEALRLTQIQKRSVFAESPWNQLRKSVSCDELPW